ncbi:SpoIVB peptidase [Clostridium cylindrosporum]|uniref:Peptidase SpoIVB n=1 Tax=Clostridium cylindrosporum DSM 605 TaxID=1121307 RepID=A0A0J8DAL2_CLOCY|nr:SpoIVB peptidase [Clostridium cylindrosporum]KMT21359.1 peptidase SpoIVB [Clostridium cylindrosporum DSM 605]
MKIKYTKILITLSIIIAVTFSFAFVKVASLPSVVKITNNKLELVNLSDKKLKSNFIYTVEAFSKNSSTSNQNINLNVKLFGLIPVKKVTLNLKPEVKVIPGGKPVGIKLLTEGIIVVGFSDVETKNGKKESPGVGAGIEIGDILLEANGEELVDINTLSNTISKSKGKIVKFKIKRKDSIISKSINPIESDESSQYKIGLWVRNSTSGVGTLTFYEENSGKFGALGHPINDVDTGKMLSIKEGSTYNAKIISVEKGEKGKPGELRGVFTEKDKVGSLNKNTFSGVYGISPEMWSDLQSKKAIPIARQSEVKEGPAKILACVDGTETKEYDIIIERLNSQTKPSPKSMIIKVIDNELLEKTGGIVQGMSGSPIIQDGKLVGAVTHVFVNKPNMGYGIYIEWMLNEVKLAS